MLILAAPLLLRRLRRSPSYAASRGYDHDHNNRWRGGGWKHKDAWRDEARDSYRDVDHLRRAAFKAVEDFRKKRKKKWDDD